MNIQLFFIYIDTRITQDNHDERTQTTQDTNNHHERKYLLDYIIDDHSIINRN
jgi:hypothetical protein